MSGPIVRALATGSASPFKLTSTEKLVLLCIADHMRGNPTAWPSHREMARWCSLSQSGVKKTIGALCGEAGPLTRTLRQGRHGTFYEYSIREGVTARLGHEVTESPRVLTGSPQVRGGVTTSHVNRKEASIKQSGADAWLDEADGLWRKVGNPPRWFRVDVGKLVTSSRGSEDVLAALRCFLSTVDTQKPSVELLRAFCQNVAQWVTKAKPKAEVYSGSDEQRRAKAERYGIAI